MRLQTACYQSVLKSLAIYASSNRMQSKRLQTAWNLCVFKSLRKILSSHTYISSLTFQAQLSNKTRALESSQTINGSPFHNGSRIYGIIGCISRSACKKTIWSGTQTSFIVSANYNSFRQSICPRDRRKSSELSSSQAYRHSLPCYPTLSPKRSNLSNITSAYNYSDYGIHTKTEEGFLVKYAA